MLTKETEFGRTEDRKDKLDQQTIRPTPNYGQPMVASYNQSNVQEYGN